MSTSTAISTAHLALALATLLAAAAPAQAELLAIGWDAGGRLERRLEVAAGGFAEACGALAKGQRVAWRFEAAAPLDFNVHYHVGKQVVYPVQDKDRTRAEGTLPVALDQEYCWMWTNRGAAPVALTLSLAR